LRASRSGSRSAHAVGRCDMTTSMSGMVLMATLFLFLATGMPIAFALGLAAMGGLFMAIGFEVIGIVAETMFAGIGNLAFVSIPMFVLMGAIVAGSPAGADLYRALDRWLYK